MLYTYMKAYRSFHKTIKRSLYSVCELWSLSIYDCEVITKSFKMWFFVLFSVTVCDLKAMKSSFRMSLYIFDFALDPFRLASCVERTVSNELSKEDRLQLLILFWHRKLYTMSIYCSSIYSDHINIPREGIRVVTLKCQTNVCFSLIDKLKTERVLANTLQETYANPASGQIIPNERNGKK